MGISGRRWQQRSWPSAMGSRSARRLCGAGYGTQACPLRPAEAPHRTWRERKAHAGELLQLDGSHHDWLEGRGPRCVLMAYIDDASSRVYARFYEYEGTIPAMDSFTRYVRGMEFPSRSMRIGIRPISRSPRRRWRSSWRVGSPRVSLSGRWTNWGAS